MRKSILAFGLLLLPSVALAKPTQIKPGEMFARVKINAKGIAEVEVPLQGKQTSRLSITIAGAEVQSIKAQGTRKAARGKRTVRPWNLKVVSEEKLLEQLREQGACLQMSQGDTPTDPLEFSSWDKLGLSPDLYAQFKTVFTQIHSELGDNVGPGRCGKISSGSMVQLTQLFYLTFKGAWSPQITCQFVDSPFLDASYVYFGVVTQDATQKSAIQQNNDVAFTRLARTSPRSEVSGPGIYLTTFFKDACVKNDARKLNYIARFRIKVKKAATLTVGVTEETYEGKKGATIKPISEGKFAPNPLLLMEMTRQCGVSITESVWKNGRPKLTSLKPEDLIRYSKRIFVRVNMGGKLQGGGKASYDLSDTDTAYGVCFSRQAVRQYVNDYPEPVGGSDG